jgi:pimeloyl-ACP methyl ester carboxylesterase
LVEIINYFKKDNRFDKIIIAGHSEGSLIGMIAAKKTSSYKYISLAGVGYSADKILKQQLSKQPQAVREEAFPIIDSLKLGIEVDSLSKNMKGLFRKSVQPYMISWFKYNPVNEIKKLKIPILIINGTNDIQVDTTNANLLHKSNPNSELEIIDGMNHILKPASDNYVENLKTYYDPELQLHEELIEIIYNFIQK